MIGKIWNYLFLVLICLIVFPGKSFALLSSECSDLDFVSKNADVIVYGQVTGVEWRNEESITNNYVKVTKYLKGEGGKEIIIRTYGCTPGDACWPSDGSVVSMTLMEDEASYEAGATGFLYLNKEGTFYRPICGLGIVNEAPPLFPYIRETVAFGSLFLLAILVLFAANKRKDKKINPG